MVLKGNFSKWQENEVSWLAVGLITAAFSTQGLLGALVEIILHSTLVILVVLALLYSLTQFQEFDLLTIAIEFAFEIISYLFDYAFFIIAIECLVWTLSRTAGWIFVQIGMDPVTKSFDWQAIICAALIASLIYCIWWIQKTYSS